jgi:glycosyltransferase involved in cell wall biosynthesis
VTVPAFSAVIPVYNDRNALERAIPLSIQYLSGISADFELIIAEDGSTDGSAELVKEFSLKDPRVRLLHSDERLGRGRALNRAFRDAKAPVVCYYDVDLATGMEHLKELIGAIEGGYDIATGSRLLPDSRIQRTGGREFASRGYNLLVRSVLGSRLHDHQCGFKSFRRDRVIALSERVKSPHWFWDTEILVRAQRAGYRVMEFPVHWEQGPGTTVRKSDVIGMGLSVFRLWWQVHVQED